jgi:hypothetical protein
MSISLGYRPYVNIFGVQEEEEGASMGTLVFFGHDKAFTSIAFLMNRFRWSVSWISKWVDPRPHVVLVAPANEAST